MLYQTQPTGDGEEYLILQLESDSWPPVDYIRVNFNPEFNNRSSSLWSFLASNIPGKTQLIFAMNFENKVIQIRTRDERTCIFF